MDHQTGWIMGSNYLLIEGFEAKNVDICLSAIMYFVFLCIIPKVQHINKTFRLFNLHISDPMKHFSFRPLVVPLCNTIGLLYALTHENHVMLMAKLVLNF